MYGNKAKYNTWRQDLSDACIALDKIKDTVLPKLISGNIYSVEQEENEILMLLDQHSGVDYIREDENGLQGIASRVQFGRAWNTFTIRYKRHSGAMTEYEKRVLQISKGYFYPAFTLQAYFTCKKHFTLLSVAVVKTIDLYQFLETHPRLVRHQKSDNRFLYIGWDDLINNGVAVKTYYNL